MSFTKKSKLEKNETEVKVDPNCNPNPPSDISLDQYFDLDLKPEDRLHLLLLFFYEITEYSKESYEIDTKSPEKSILTILIICANHGSETMILNALTIYTSLPEVKDINLNFKANGDRFFTRGSNKETKVKWTTEGIENPQSEEGIKFQSGFGEKCLCVPLIIWLYILVPSYNRTDKFVECVEMICNHDSFDPRIEAGNCDNVLSFIISITPTEYRKNLVRDLSPLLGHKRVMPYLNGEVYRGIKGKSGKVKDEDKDKDKPEIEDFYKKVGNQLSEGSAVLLLEKIMELGVDLRKLDKPILHTFLGKIKVYKFLEKKKIKLNYNDKGKDGANVLQSLYNQVRFANYSCNEFVFLLNKTGFNVKFVKKTEEVVVKGGNPNIYFGDDKKNLLMAIAEKADRKFRAVYYKPKTFSWHRLIMGLIDYFHDNKKLAYTDSNGRNILYYLHSPYDDSDCITKILDKNVIDLTHKDKEGDTFADYIYKKTPHVYEGPIDLFDFRILNHEIISNNCTFFKKDDPDCLRLLNEELIMKPSVKMLLIAFSKGVDIFRECEFLDKKLESSLLSILKYYEPTQIEKEENAEKMSKKCLSPFNIVSDYLLWRSNEFCDVDNFSILLDGTLEKPKGEINFAKTLRIDLIEKLDIKLSIGSVLLVLYLKFFSVRNDRTKVDTENIECLLDSIEKRNLGNIKSLNEKVGLVESHCYHDLIHNSKLLLFLEEYKIKRELLTSLTYLRPSQEILCERNLKYTFKDCDEPNLFELFFHHCVMNDNSNEFLFFARRMIPLTYFDRVLSSSNVNVYNRYNAYRQLTLARMFDEGSIVHSIPLDIWRLMLIELGMWQFLPLYEIERDKGLRELEDRRQKVSWIY